MPGGIFGSVEWALDKIRDGYINGCPPKLSDCHKRAGYCVRVLQLVSTDAQLILYATPSKHVAHSAIQVDGKLIKDPADALVIERISEYHILGKGNICDMASALDNGMADQRIECIDNVAGTLIKNGMSPGYTFDAVEKTLLKLPEIINAHDAAPNAHNENEETHYVLEEMERQHLIEGFSQGSKLMITESGQQALSQYRELRADKEVVRNQNLEIGM